MKTIGLLGGMSWHSTALYYQLINEGVQKRLGGLHSARLLIASVEFNEIAQLQSAGEWEQAGQILSDDAQKLQRIGADFLVIGTNTMHISVPMIEAAVDIPLLHIADATADAILAQGYHSTGLLGTRYTMQMDYYISRLRQKGLNVLVPDEDAIHRVDEVIFKELCYGDIQDDSRRDYLEIIDDLQNKGVECVIEGCTEIALLVKQEHTSIKLFDTTAIHAEAVVEYALQDD
jgi:aspartate racemase